eukprot:SAG22_NODE_2955_length_2078_cov_2.058110_2_plen_327_part_00
MLLSGWSRAVPRWQGLPVHRPGAARGQPAGACSLNGFERARTHSAAAAADARPPVAACLLPPLRAARSPQLLEVRQPPAGCQLSWPCARPTTPAACQHALSLCLSQVRVALPASTGSVAHVSPAAGGEGRQGIAEVRHTCIHTVLNTHAALTPVHMFGLPARGAGAPSAHVVSRLGSLFTSAGVTNSRSACLVRACARLPGRAAAAGAAGQGSGAGADRGQVRSKARHCLSVVLPLQFCLKQCLSMRSGWAAGAAAARWRRSAGGLSAAGGGAAPPAKCVQTHTLTGILAPSPAPPPPLPRRANLRPKPVLFFPWRLAMPFCRRAG